MTNKGADSTKLDTVRRLAKTHGASTRKWCEEQNFALDGEALWYALCLEHAWWIRSAVGMIFTGAVTWLFTKLG